MTDFNPTDPIPLPSRAEAELAQVEARRAILLAQVEAEREARDAAAAPLRSLAIRLHQAMCMERHDGTGACSWHADSQADNPDAADWTQLDHHRWLLVAHAGVYHAQLDGWTVLPPEPAPVEPDNG